MTLLTYRNPFTRVLLVAVLAKTDELVRGLEHDLDVLVDRVVVPSLRGSLYDGAWWQHVEPGPERQVELGADQRERRALRLGASVGVAGCRTDAAVRSAPRDDASGRCRPLRRVRADVAINRLARRRVGHERCQGAVGERGDGVRCRDQRAKRAQECRRVVRRQRQRHSVDWGGCRRCRRRERALLVEGS